MRRGKERVKEVPVSFVRKLKLVEKTCPTCQQKFEGVKKRTYCSRRCQAKADYDRHAEAYRKARMDSYYAQKEQTP